MSGESIFGHVVQEIVYSPPIGQEQVMSLESDLAVRPTVDDVNPSTSTVFSSDRTTELLTTKLSKTDVKDFAISTQETNSQAVVSQITTDQTTFDADQQLVTKKYVDNNAGGGTPIPHSMPTSTSLAIGTDANMQSSSRNHITAVGWRSHSNVTNGVQNSVCFGSMAGRYYQGGNKVFVGYAAGGGG